MYSSKIALLGFFLSALLASRKAAADSGPTLNLPPEEQPAAHSEPNAADNATTIGGYGELHYAATRPESGPTTNEIDMHRMVLYVAKRFSESISFRSEIEVEHAIAGAGQVGEVAVEQALIDYRFTDEGASVGVMGMRAGVMLVPMGIVNVQHEPPSFHGVERPSVESLIIPSTWREGGLSLYHRPTPKLDYQIMLMGGLDASKFSTAKGIRAGRQKVGEARTDGLAVAARVQYKPTLGSILGLSGYFNQAGKNSDRVSAKAQVLGFAADARAKFLGFETRAVFAMFKIGDSEKLSTLTNLDGSTNAVPNRVWGTYGELAYDVLRAQEMTEQLLPFARVEYYDTDASDKTRSVLDLVVGLTFRPVPQVAFKSDVTMRRKGGDTVGDNSNTLHLGIGFLY